MRADNVVIIDEDGNETALAPGVYRLSATMTVDAGVVEDPVEDDPIIDDIDEEFDEVVNDEIDDQGVPVPIPEPGPSPMIVNIDKSDFISFSADWPGGGAYRRHQTHITLKGNEGAIRIVRLGNIGGRTLHSPKPFVVGDTYTLQANGIDIATTTVEKTAKFLVIKFPLLSMDEGWHILGIKELSTRLFPVYVMKGATPQPQEWMPVVTSSHDFYLSLKKEDAPKHVVEWVPTRFTPTPRPLADRVFTPFSEPLNPRNLARANLAMRPNSDPLRPAITNEGIWTTANHERYYYWHSFRKLPIFPLLDGPRGVGCISGVYHMTIGRGQVKDEPGSPLLGNVYALDGWRLVRISKNGHITTLVGYRSVAPGKYHDHITNGSVHDEDSLELVGDWSAIPKERHGMQGPWGFAIAPYSVTVDHNQAPIATEDGRLPHHTGPVFFIADTMGDRILRVEFDARKHDVPAKVTEFITGISNPFECVEWNSKLIVSERGSHRVVQYDMKTGELERIILQGPGKSTLKQSSQTVKYDLPKLPGESFKDHRKRAVVDVRQHETDSPEGLYVVDDLLYVASSTALNVVTVDLVSGVKAIAVPELRRYYTPVGTKYTKITVSDGTFGPKGAVFVSRWIVRDSFAYLPDGRVVTKWTAGHLGYDTCVAIHEGRAVIAGSAEGLIEYRLKLSSDEVVDRARFKRGAAIYKDHNYNLTNGWADFNYQGIEVPEGIDDDLDYFLRISHSNNIN